MLTFCFRFRSFLLLFRFLSSASVLLPATWPLFLPFHSSRLCLTAASPALRFLSSYPASLPQLLHRCFPSFPLSLLFRAFPFPPLSFVRFGSVLTTQPSVSSFPLFPISPDGGSLGALWFLASPLLSSSVRPVSMPSFRFVSQALLSCRPPVYSSAVSFAFALGFGYSACRFRFLFTSAT